MSIKAQFMERIRDGLKRKSVQRCSTWAEHYRKMSNQFTKRQDSQDWTFKYHPWTREMHDSKAIENYGQKAAQMGFTEWLLNRCFFAIDIKGWDTLYVLPSKSPDASDFSAARFDAALQLSPHLASMFSDVRNVGHKMAGTVNMYIRGSNAKGPLKSVPAAILALDEYDEMTQENIPLVKERVSGQFEYQINGVSTPTIDDYGINKEYKLSSQEHYFFKCPRCSRSTQLVFPDCLVITGEHLTDPKLKDSHLICKECKGLLEHETKWQWLADGFWVPEVPHIKEVRGFTISQLYSSTITPLALARAAIKAKYDPADEQELYNSKLGLTHVVEGARITDGYIDSCRGEHINGAPPGHRLVTMGVDVGRRFHVWIDEWDIGQYIGNDLNTDSTPRNLLHTTVTKPSDLDDLMLEYRVMGAVIDAQPERRTAFEFSQRFPGHVWMCFYSRGVSGKDIHVSKDSDGEPTIKVDRTSWLDQGLGRFRQNSIMLPRNVDHECRENLKALVRVFEKDSDGNPYGRYIKAVKDDHFAHARTYSEIALPLANAIFANRSIEGIL